MVESFKSHLFKSKFAKYNLLKIRGGRAEHACLCGWSCEVWDVLFYIPYNKGKKKLCKLYTNPTFNPASLWFPPHYECIVCAANPTQTLHWTIHWGVSNPTQKLYMKAYTATWTLHKNYTQNPTLQPYIATARSLLRSARSLLRSAPS